LETVFDWITVAIFAGLIVLFMQRSTAEEPARDSIWQYLGASVGCAAVNYLGNNGYMWPALLLLAGVVGYIIFVLKPFDLGRHG
jgi:Ca2+/Na+ antiporter